MTLPWGLGTRRRQVQLLVAMASLGAVAAVPYFTDAYVTQLVLTGLVYVILASSWNLLGGYTGYISLGHAAFFGLGAYVSAWITTPVAAGFPASIALPALPAIVLAGVATAALALLLGPVLFRLRGHYFSIGTLALAAVMQILMTTNTGLSGGSTGYYVAAGDTLLRYFYGIGFTLLCLASLYYVLNSKSGYAMRAIRGDEEAADSLGVNPMKYKVLSLVISSFWAGIAGAVYAQYTLYVNPDSTMGVMWTVRTLVIVIIGGIGTFLGPILGSGIFVLFDNLLQEYFQGLFGTVEGVLIILFIIFLPYGIYGHYKRSGLPVSLGRLRE